MPYCKSVDINRTFLITGAAGFIGYFLAKRLLENDYRVVGIDNLNEYYDIDLKRARLDQLMQQTNFTHVEGDISNKDTVAEVFIGFKPGIVISLAAQAGVRYSIDNPDAYIQSNIIGFINILEACRHYPVEHLVYASSSSVYGTNNKIPFEESDVVDHPVSLYAATKKSNELMAYTYSHLYQIPATGLRFFTVYGPMGRPDMAYYKFANDHFAGKSIRLFNNGDLEHDLLRDFTYIDDIVEGIVRLLDRRPDGEIRHRIFNIGNNSPVRLMDFVAVLEQSLSRATGRTIVFDKVFEPRQPGDVPATYASIDLLRDAVGFSPATPIEVGLQKFADWYVSYHGIR